MTIQVPALRPLPVIVLADTSGSMAENGKIAILNQALADMQRALAAQTDVRGELQLGLVTFGGDEATVHQRPLPVGEVALTPFSAAGRTPMGAAFTLVHGLLADPNVVPVRAFAPTLVLVSDGQPTDAWRPALAALLASDKGKKAQRFALAIGIDCNREVLREFAGSDERLIEAADASQIVRFFRWVTMSIVLRSQAANPNAPMLPLYTLSDDT